VCPKLLWGVTGQDQQPAAGRSLPTGSLAEQIADEEVQIQEMADTYSVIEEMFDKAVKISGSKKRPDRHCSRRRRPTGSWLVKHRKPPVP